MYDEPEFQSLELRDFGNTGTAVVSISLDDYYTEYVVKVQAINDIGVGPISNERVVYSAEDMPQAAPQLVSATSFNSTALNVTWQPISQDRETVRGRLIGYRVSFNSCYLPANLPQKIWKKPSESIPLCPLNSVDFLVSFRSNIGRPKVLKQIVFIIFPEL